MYVGSIPARASKLKSRQLMHEKSWQALRIVSDVPAQRDHIVPLNGADVGSGPRQWQFPNGVVA